jgi:hypothetical protein
MYNVANGECIFKLSIGQDGAKLNDDCLLKCRLSIGQDKVELQLRSILAH